MAKNENKILDELDDGARYLKILVRSLRALLVS